MSAEAVNGIGLSQKTRADFRKRLLQQTPATVREAWHSFWKEFGGTFNDAGIGPAHLFEGGGFTTMEL